MGRTAAFFRLEGALSEHSALAGAAWLASNAPRMRHRLLGLGGVALSASLRGRDPALTAKLAWSLLRGFSEDRLAILGEDWASERVLPSIRPEARRLVDEARARGALLVLVSESLDVVAEPVAKTLGFDRTISNALEMVEGEATGVLREPRVGPEIDPRRIRELAAHEGIDLARSAAYGASRADGLLLSLVGLPCALEPDRELARMARDLDWPVVRTAAPAEEAR